MDRVKENNITNRDHQSLNKYFSFYVLEGAITTYGIPYQNVSDRVIQFIASRRRTNANRKRIF